MSDGELTELHDALGVFIQEVRRRGLPRHIEGKVEAVRDMIELVMKNP